jgi:hypothetical protein
MKWPDMSIVAPACFGAPIAWKISFFPFFHFKFVFVFAREVHFLQATSDSVLFFNPILQSFGWVIDHWLSELILKGLPYV